jgi:DNA-binding NarL/FixJ family response regulator
MLDQSVRELGLYIVEEQEIYNELYKSVFSTRQSIRLLGISNSLHEIRLNREMARLAPGVLMLSAKRLDAATIKELEEIRTEQPKLGLVLLLVYYNTSDIEMLRKVAITGTGGMALFLKQSLDLVEQLHNIVIAAHQGQVILDPKLTTLLLMGKPEFPFLKLLTNREMEILSLLAKGYSNASIARTLYIDLKTVEHHINNMYSKLKTGMDFDQKHPRVSAARLYLEAAGELTIPVGVGKRELM